MKRSRTISGDGRPRLESFNEEEEHKAPEPSVALGASEPGPGEEVRPGPGEEPAAGEAEPGAGAGARGAAGAEGWVAGEEEDDSTGDDTSSGSETENPEEKQRIQAMLAKREEAKLKSKYPGLMQGGGGAGSAFLAQRNLRRAGSTEAEEGGGRSAATPTPTPADDPRDQALVAKREEAKLKSKYPGLKAGGGSSFLAQRKLQRGNKFFDSGDYNLVKEKKKATGLSGAASGSSRTKPETAPAEPEVPEKKPEVDIPIATSELSDVIPTADVIISRRMALFRTRSESSMDGNPFLLTSGGTSGAPRAFRSGSLFVSSPAGPGAHVTAAAAGVRRGSMFPMMPSSGGLTGSDAMPLPGADYLERRRQSMVPAIPSKLAQ